MKSPKIVNGDLVFENGDVVWVEGDEDLVQSTSINFKTRLGEFFLEEDAGLSRDNILGKNFDDDLIRDDIIEAAMKDERIASVEDIEITNNRVERKRIISFTITKEDGGTVQLEEVEV